ncbi:MAG: TetR/AcrR family transcriptional regulator [Syntrophomonas sp.]|nr:TetR/AcrR family transcriptional regulator [Syntrophomonas sp.]
MATGNMRESKRELIMAAAIQVFSHKGYHQSKMEEIAVEAGIGKGTIYEYFPSKLQLLQEIMEQSFHLYDHCFGMGISPAFSLEERIKVLVQGHLQFCQDNKDLTRIIFLDTDVIDEELRKWAWQKRVEKEQRLQQFFETAIKRGEMKPVDTRLLTVMVGGILMSFWAPIVVGNWQIQAESAAQQITDILMRGIGLDDEPHQQA